MKNMTKFSINYKKQNSCKGIYTFDLLVAVLTLLIMFYFGTIYSAEFRDGIHLISSEFSGKSKAFLISEKLITRDIAFSNTQTYQNYVDPGLWQKINTTKYLQDFELNAINITSSFSASASEGIFVDGDIFCYTRIVLVKELLSNKLRTIKVCIQNGR